MSLGHGAGVVRSGLVFHYDMGNTQKSWKGKPTTNFFTNGNFSNGAGIPQESGSTPTNSIIYFPYNPGETAYVLQQNGSFTEYQINLTTELLASTTYCMSGWYANSLDYNSTETMFHSRAFSTSGANVSLGIGIGTVLETRVINGITWKYCYATITTPADYNNIFNWYLGYGADNTTGYRYYTNIQMELGTYPSRFVNGTRSNTQAIVDLTGNNTVTATSLTYASDNTFSFNGTSNRIISSTTTFNRTTGQELTVSCWLKPSRLSGQYQIICESRSENAATLNWAVYQHATDGAISFHGSAQNKSSYIPSTSAWVFVTNTVTTAGVSTLYINGISNSVVTGYTYGGTPSYFSIGANGNGTEPFLGSIPNVQIYNRALSATEVLQNFNALRDRYFGYQQLTYTASSNVTLTNNGTQDVSMFKNADNNVWNGEVRSTEVFTAPCTIEFSKQAASGDNGASYAMIGWNEDPTLNTTYTSLDHASYPYRTDIYSVYNNGSQVLFTGTWDVNKRFYIVYDTDGFIRHYNGSTLLYSANYGTNKVVYVDSSFYSVNSTFGGFSNVKVARSSWNGTNYV